jgi:hypothetical protein
MNINKRREYINTTDSNKSKEDTFNINDEELLIRKECDSLLKNINSIIKKWFLKKEYYPNPSN